MAGIDVTGGGGLPVALTQDIYLNNNGLGQIDYQNPVNVYITDSVGNYIAPSIVTYANNTLTATMPNSGILFRFPTPSQYVSYRTGDTGWRFQNGWYNINIPTQISKIAALNPLAGAASFFTLQTPLTVNGVSSTVRFVDINGVQTFSIANNGNLTVIDKLTGLMYTRFTNVNGLNWNQTIDAALSYSVAINGITYDDWYLIGANDWSSIFGTETTTQNFIDPVSGITLISMPTAIDREVRIADSSSAGASWGWNFAFTSPSSGLGKGSTNMARTIFVRDARNLIS